MNFAFYVSGRAGRLLHYIEENSVILKDVILVISDEYNPFLEKKLKDLNIEFIFFNYNKEKLKREENLKLSNFMLEKFLEFNITYCYCYGIHLLKGELLNKYEDRIINFHPSVLPLFPGLKSIDKAMGDYSTNFVGNTAHMIDSTVDGGKIIVQNVFPKSKFLKSGYDAILNSQKHLIELIHKNILGEGIYIKNNLIFLKVYSKSDIEERHLLFNYE